jgi:hypothetical protein
MTAEQKDHAINTGIETATSMMAIQQEALRRMQQGGRRGAASIGAAEGAYTPPARGMAPTEMAETTKDLQSGRQQRFEACVDQKLDKIMRPGGDAPTRKQQMAIVQECGG